MKSPKEVAYEILEGKKPIHTPEGMKDFHDDKNWKDVDSKHFVGEGFAQQGAEAREQGKWHERRVAHHEQQADHHTSADNRDKAAFHKTAANHHQHAADNYHMAAKHFASGKEYEAEARMDRAERHADAAHDHSRFHHLDQVHEGLAARVVGHAARLAVSDRHVGLHQFGDVAQAGAEYAVHQGEEILKSKLKQIKRGARKAIRSMASPKKEPVTEMTRKDQIDDIGRHHAARIDPASESDYHRIMRNRASRLKSLRDRTGPTPGNTKFKAGRQRMLGYAGEDSREAKRIKPS